jgi:hypothetical protein
MSRSGSLRTVLSVSDVPVDDDSLHGEFDIVLLDAYAHGRRPAFDEHHRIADPRDRVASALDMCAAVWRAGILGDTTVPRLVACLRPDEVIAVFPGGEAMSASDLCHRVGLAPMRQ